MSSVSSRILILLLSMATQSLAQDCDKLALLLSSANILEADVLMKDVRSGHSGCPVTYGQYYLLKGRNDLAEPYFKTASASKDQAIRADGMNNLGLIYWNTGNAEQAVDYIQEALQIRLKHYGADHEKVAASYNDLGLVYSRYDSDKALKNYELAYRIYLHQHGNRDIKTVQSLINIGLQYRSLELYGDAIVNFEKGQQALESMFPNGHPLAGFIYSSLGLTYREMGQMDKSLTSFDKALKIYQSNYGQKHPEIAKIHNLLGQHYHQTAAFEKAIEYYQRALIANAISFNDMNPLSNPGLNDYYSSFTLLNGLFNKAKAYTDLHFNKTLKFNDLKTSLSLLHQCDTLIDNIRATINSETDKISLSNLATEIYESGVELCRMMGDLVVKKDPYYEEAFYFAEKSKSVVLQDAIADAQAKNFSGIPDYELEREQRLKSSINFHEQQLMEVKDREAIRHTLFQLKEEYLAFSRMLEETYPAYYELRYNSQIPGVHELQKKLPDNHVVLSYFISRSTQRLYIFEISARQYKIHHSELAADFDRYCKGFRNSLMFQVPEVFDMTSLSLSAWLLPKKIKKDPGQLTIIPFGILGTIPFEVLLTSDKNSDKPHFERAYLIKSQAVNYHYAASLLYSALSQTQSKRTSIALLCAPVSFTAFPDLPGTETELEGVGKILVNNAIHTTTALRSDATESLIKSSDLASYDYLHFATHGMVNENHPALSAIFLKSDEQNDGNLFAGEIYNLKLNASLITLSACETGLGRVAGGEGIIGLTRALLYAGAQNSLVSLWKVSDNATSALMQTFYGRMENRQYSQALRAAKLRMLNQPEYADPYNWAPFILVGL